MNDTQCWLDCRSRFVGQITLKTECCPEVDCGKTDDCAMKDAARLAYKNAMLNMGKMSQASFEGRAAGSYRSAADLERMRAEIKYWEGLCPDEPELTCHCIGGCMKCKPKRRHPAPLQLRYTRRH